MKTVFNLILIFCLAGNLFAANNHKNTITISGQVTDFNGCPIDNCHIILMNPDFHAAYETYSDENGRYKLENVKKGKYMALEAIRHHEYPRQNSVPEDDMRLEYWAWNVIANEDLTINPRYHRLELYGTTAFKTNAGYMVYFRPMSLIKSLSYGKDIYLDKEKGEKITNLSVKPENLKVNIFADEEPLKINSIQSIEEFGGEGNITITGYIVQVDKPKGKTNKPYIIFRVEAENTEDCEKGENIYFYELPDYNTK